MDPISDARARARSSVSLEELDVERYAVKNIFPANSFADVGTLPIRRIVSSITFGWRDRESGEREKDVREGEKKRDYIKLILFE